MTMGIKKNPRKIKGKNLRYFFEDRLKIKYTDKDEEYDIGQGRTYDIPKIKYSQQTLKPLKEFKYGDREYRPQDAFYSQNDHKFFGKTPKRFQKKNVDKRIKRATKMPKLRFSLKPVKLVKPKYGKNFKTGF